MPSSATGGSSPRAAYCATPCFPAHARAERAVPAPCSTMCSDGLVVFLTCVLCCTKRMHLGRWILSEESGSAYRSYSGVLGRCGVRAPNGRTANGGHTNLHTNGDLTMDDSSSAELGGRMRRLAQEAPKCGMPHRQPQPPPSPGKGDQVYLYH